MLSSELIIKLFDAAYMQRWNDKLRPMEFYELDKQGHKMFIAFFLAKFEELKQKIDWVSLIKGIIFEYLQRLVITDIKPTVFYEIKKDKIKYKALNNYMFRELSPLIKCLGNDFSVQFQNYFINGDNNINRQILDAAHLFSSYWEFQILQRIDPNGFEVKYIKNHYQVMLKQYKNLKGITLLIKQTPIRQLINLIGQLRFQNRWSHVHRIPKTSVLGHSFYVAILVFLFSLYINACSKRLYNNTISALFHDLPEILTRDIISPIKRADKGLEDLIKELEIKQLEKIILPLVPGFLQDEILLYTQNEFNNLVKINGKIVYIENEKLISEKYNQDQYNPRDGKLIKAFDDLSAFIEAFSALKNGCSGPAFSGAMERITEKYEKAELIANKISIKKLLKSFKL